MALIKCLKLLRSLFFFFFNQVLGPEDTRESQLCLFPQGADNLMYKCVDRILEETLGREELGTQKPSKRTSNGVELENAHSSIKYVHQQQASISCVLSIYETLNS